MTNTIALNHTNFTRKDRQVHRRLFESGLHTESEAQDLWNAWHSSEERAEYMARIIGAIQFA